jgi:Fic family protein
MGDAIRTLQTRWGITPRMTDSLRRIGACRELLERHLSELEPWHGAIRKQVMASVVHYSTKIEGNRLTREQVESIIAGEVIEAPEKDKTEAINYLRAMQWAQTRADEPNWRLSHESITTLHFLVGQNLGDDYAPLGKYREAQNQVSDKQTGQAIYWPPRPAEVHALMTDFVAWVRDLSTLDIDPYIANAIVHLVFVAIHPFSDGNGRVARVLCSLLMMREGYKAQAFYSLEEYFGVHWMEYGQRIEAALGPRWYPEAADCSDWIEWYLDAVAEQVAQAEQAVNRTIAQVGVFILLLAIDKIDIDRRSVLALWLARRDGHVTNRVYRSAVDVSSKTAATALARLVDAGYLAAIGQKRGARYVLGPQVTNRNYDALVDTWISQGPDAVFQAAIPNEDDPQLFDT